MRLPRRSTSPHVDRGNHGRSVSSPNAAVRRAATSGAIIIALCAGLSACTPASEDEATNEVADAVASPDIGAELAPETVGGPTLTPTIQQLATALSQAKSNATAAAPATAAADAADEIVYNDAVVAEIESVVSGLFTSKMGVTDPEWQDVTVRRMSTRQLSRLRRQPTPPPGAYRATEGSIWVVGFRTPLPVTPDVLIVDNTFELQDVENEDLPDENGLTTVYYILSVTGMSQLQYTPLAQGILPAEGAPWGLDDLIEMPIE